MLSSSLNLQKRMSEVHVHALHNTRPLHVQNLMQNTVFSILNSNLDNRNKTTPKLQLQLWRGGSSIISNSCYRCTPRPLDPAHVNAPELTQHCAVCRANAWIGVFKGEKNSAEGARCFLSAKKVHVRHKHEFFSRHMVYYSKLIVIAQVWRCDDWFFLKNHVQNFRGGKFSFSV